MNTKDQVVGLPLAPPPIEVVKRESAILEQILHPRLHEIVIQEALKVNLPPFKMLGVLIAEAVGNRIVIKVQAAYASKPQKLDTPQKLWEHLKGYNPAKGMTG